MSQKFMTSLSAVVAICLAGGLTACGGGETAEETVIRPVRYEEALAVGAKRERQLSGIAKAGVESQLSFRVGGTIEDLAVTVGRDVSKGDLIARLDATDMQLQLQEAEAALAQAEAAERKAEADYDRVRGLYENQIASKSDLDAARAQAESTGAQVEAARQRLARARRQLSYTRLTAPLDGAIAAVRAEVNENIQPGQTVALLASGSRPEVEVAVPEALISQVREGDAAEVTFDALPGAVFPAVVTEVGVAMTGNASAFLVTVLLEVSDGAIRSGMAATVTLRFGPHNGSAVGSGGKERILVRPVAVGEDRGGRYVFVLEPEAAGEPDDTGERLAVARRRAVEVGELTPEGLEIRAGLADGELVATAGVRRIRDGQTVKLLAVAGGGV